MKPLTLAKHVDNYIESLFIPEDESLIFAIKNSKKHNLPPIEISPVIGKFLYLQAKIINAKNILEFGTLGGYSTLWLAKALPTDGKIITIDHNKDYAAVAQENFKNAKMENKIQIKIGEALEVLKTLKPTFDFIFIDAHKEEYIKYMDYAIALSHQGTVIICDNVIRNGGVLEEKPTKEYYKSLAAFNKYLANDPRLDSTIFPLLLPFPGRDYLDGLSISIVK